MHKQMMIAVVLFSVPSYAAQSYWSGSAPAGVTSTAWKQMVKRADWVTNAVKAISPKADAPCIHAVLLKLLGKNEVAWSRDAEGDPSMRRTVAAGKEGDFTNSLKKNVDDKCSGGDGGGLAQSLEGAFAFTANQDEWQQANFDNAKKHVTRAVESLVRLGVLLPAAEGAAAAAGAGLIVDPRVFTDPTKQPADGT